MQIPRRLLPSVPLLCAFEAAARTGSVSAAARELNLTQGAVSRQIRALEEQLGAQLFVRERQSIRLTLAGDSYARDIRDALRRIGMAALNFRANPSGGTLNLAVLPTFGARWLAPRLRGFLDAHPEVMLNVISRQGELDFRAEPLDAAVCRGVPPIPNLQSLQLQGETILPLCSPAAKAGLEFATASDVRQLPLLILISRPDAWERWLATHGAFAEDVHGMMFDQFGPIIEAASAGLGAALLPTFLVDKELARGELVPVIDLPVAGDEAYHLVWPAERRLYPPLLRFKEWLAGSWGPTATTLVPLSRFAAEGQLSRSGRRARG